MNNFDIFKKEQDQGGRGNKGGVEGDEFKSWVMSQVLGCCKQFRFYSTVMEVGWKKGMVNHILWDMMDLYDLKVRV